MPVDDVIDPVRPRKQQPAGLTIRFEKDETIAALDKLAKATQRSRNWLINRAIDDYVALQAWQIGKIEEGLAAAERGEFVPDGEIERILAKYGTAG